MPIYPYHCKECDELWDEVIRYDDKPEKCPACGKDNMERLLGIPQRPKVQSSDPQKRWGYNKTTTDYLFDGEGRKMAHQYDENKRKAQVKEFAEKQSRKGATVAVKAPTKKSKKTSKK